MSDQTDKRISDLEGRVSAIENTLKGTTATPTRGRKLGISEFFREKGPTSTVNVVLVAGVYHDKFEDGESFSATDLLGLIRKAKKQKPGNINEAINGNIRKGYFEEDASGDDKKKRWFVTDSGLDFVDNNLGHNEKAR